MRSRVTVPATSAVVLGLSLIVAGVAGGCGEKKRTEIVLGVATDLDAPDPLTLVSLDVFKLPENIPVAMQPLDISGNVNNVYRLPGTFAVYSASGAADRIRVKLTGVRRKNSQEMTLVVRTAVMNLVPGRTLFVRLGVVTACIGKLDCGEGLTCIDGTCRSEEIDSSRLPDYHAGMEQEIACASGTSYIDTSTKQPLRVTGTSCRSGELCAEGYCLSARGTDGGDDAAAGADAADAGGGGDGSGQDGINDGGGGDAARDQGGGTDGSVAPVFGTEADYPASNDATAIAFGDLNGDGKPDLAIANNFAASGSVGIFANNGNGTFASSILYGAGPSPVAIALGDLNGDGKPDLAFANPVFGVSVVSNNGDGTFGAAASYSDSRGSRSVAIGDLNDDAKPDLAVANDSGSVSVFLNNGDGTFPAPVAYGISARGSSIVLGDLNGDTKPDLAVSNSDGTVNVLLNAGSGNFAAAVPYAVGANPVSVALGDLNGDGRPDLATANSGGTISILLNLGNGAFAAAVDHVAGTNPMSIALGDLNGDGKPDLVVACYNGGGLPLIVLMNNGDGTFGRQDYPTAAYPNSLAVGDMDGNGKADLAVVSFGNLSVLLNASP